MRFQLCEKKKNAAEAPAKQDIDEPADDHAGKGEGAGRFPSVSGRFPPANTNIPYGPIVPENVAPKPLPKSSAEVKAEPTVNTEHDVTVPFIAS